MGLMKTPVDLSKDIDEQGPAVLIISLREEMKGMGEQVSVRCQSRRRDVGGEKCFLTLCGYIYFLCQGLGQVGVGRTWDSTGNSGTHLTRSH